MVIVLLADGFEEIEALTPVDMLRRAKLQVRTVSIKDKTVTGAHNISIRCDMLADEVDYSEVDTVILPGGMPGTLNLDASPFTDIAIKAMLEKGGRIAAICAEPLILGRRGLLNGVEATCYPGFERELLGASLSKKSVVTDGNITTARGMGVAIEFAEELIGLLLSKEKAAEISTAICKAEKCNSSAVNNCCKAKREYIFPSTSLLSEYEESECDSDEISFVVNTVKKIFDSEGLLVSVGIPVCGPRIITLEITPQKSGIKVNSIMNLACDIQLALCSESVRIVSPVDGEAVIRIEIPRKKANVVGIKPLLESEEFRTAKSKTTVCLGRNVQGEPIIDDIAKMPHLIIGGATGMGKSVLMSSIIASLLYKATPCEVKLILIDPKRVEFAQYGRLPHLLHPIITESKQTKAVLRWLTEEVDRRFALLASLAVRNIDSYNEKINSSPALGNPMKKIIVIVDEIADLMLQIRNSFENNVMRIVQKARAVGIHMILATQRPTADVVSGLIKANIPSRVCFRVMSSVDSNTILDCRGAEKLLGQGDALYARNGSYQSSRIQSAFISDEEIAKIVDQIVLDNPNAGFDEEIIRQIKDLSELSTDMEEDDSENDFPLPDTLPSDSDPIKLALSDGDFLQAVEIAFKSGKISTSLIQRNLIVGYSKAIRYLEMMEELGIIGPKDGQKPRTVIISKEEWIKKIKNYKK